jgi:hypothetical protein
MLRGKQGNFPIYSRKTDKRITTLPPPKSGKTGD